MIKLKTLSIRDFGPLGSIQLAFQSGLWLISGDNRDTDAAVSNGSGKSHMLDALKWALFGEANDGTKGDALIRNGQPDAVVGVAWEDDGAEFIVTRTKARGKSATLTFVQDGNDVSLATPELTQASIEHSLGMDAMTWSNTVVYGQGDLVRFANPGTTDSERKAILKRILRLDVLDKALKLAKAQLSGIESALEAVKTRFAKGEAYIEGLGDSSALDDEIRTTSGELEGARAQVKNLDQMRKVLGLLEQRINENNELNGRLAHLRQGKSKAEQERAVALRNVAIASRESTRLANQIETMKAGTCPTCGSKTCNSREAKATLARLEQELAASNAQATEFEETSTGLVSTITEAQAGIEELEGQLEQDREWRERRLKLQSDIRAGEVAAATVERLSSRLQEFRKQKEAHASKLKAAQDTIRGLIVSRDEETSKRDVVAYWVKAFGNAGIPSLMMDSIVPVISDGANKYLEILADGDITVSFDTQSKLKSKPGEVRDKLSMGLCIEGVQGARPSGGQLRKISIAVDLALMDLVASRERAAIDFLGMDEVLDGLDAAGKTRVMDLMRHLRETRSTIMVVSHDAGIAEAFENQITIVKKDGVSTLEV